MNSLRIEQALGWIPLVVSLAASIGGGCSRSAPPSANQPASARPPVESAAPWFTEHAAAAGITFYHRSGAAGKFWIPEMMTGGVGLLDYDNDGLLDIFCVQGGSLESTLAPATSSRLYRNLGNNRFQDVTESARIPSHGYAMGCACADYDNDGFVDIYVTQIGPNLLLRNRGDGSFEDATRRAGAGDPAWGTSAAFFDYDQDGNLDLAIANYLNWSPAIEIECRSRGGIRDYCSPMSYQAPAKDTLLRNRGDGSFEDVTDAAGLGQAFGNGLGLATGDFDGDGRLDLFVANDAMPNQLWINQGNGRFTDQAVMRGCAVNLMGIPRAGMGVTAVDLLQRGQLDLFVTHLVGEGNGLFLNTDGRFMDHVAPRGPAAPSWNSTGFGVGFADFDNDGHLDLYVANGRVKLGNDTPDPSDPYAETNALLRGLGAGQFEPVTPPGGTAPPLIANSRGLALGDLNNDGRIDAVVTNRDGPIHLLLNTLPTPGHWIMLRLLDTRGRDAFNAIVRAEAGGKVFWRQLQPNQSYCSSHDPRVHIGLGHADHVGQLSILWPDGSKQVLTKLQAGQIHLVRQQTP